MAVDQPAGVSVEDRHSERDATDTLRGGGTDVIEGNRAGRRAGGAITRPSKEHGSVQQGSDAPASFGGTGSTADAGDQAPAQPAQPAEDTAASDSNQSAPLGTDIGYGTGTDSPPADSSR